MCAGQEQAGTTGKRGKRERERERERERGRERSGQL